MKVAVIGQGYVGQTIAQSASKSGHQVIGIEVNPELVKELNDGVSRIPGVTELKALIETGKYSATTDYSGIRDCEVIVIAVPTPLNAEREPDLSHLIEAVNGLNEHVVENALVINESTSYPGTLRNVIAARINKKVLFAAAPERVDPGNQKWSTKNTPRLVGGLTEEASKRAAEFYRGFCDEVHVVSTPEVAEAAKLFENTFRQVNIALVNEFAQVANALGIPTTETLNGAATKPFGFMPFFPSIGVGGHCIPVDPTYLSYAAKSVGLETKFINLANEVNLEMPKYVVGRLKELSGGTLQGKKIQIAGISYKSDVSDVRESPSLSLLKLLRAEGADALWHDELVGSWMGEVSTALVPVDIGIIATSHSGVDYSPWQNGTTMVIDVSTSTTTGWPKFL